MHNNESIKSSEIGGNFRVKHENMSRNGNQTQYCWRCFKKVTNNNNNNNNNINISNSKKSFDNGGKFFCSI